MHTIAHRLNNQDDIQARSAVKTMPRLEGDMQRRAVAGAGCSGRDSVLQPSWPQQTTV